MNGWWLVRVVSLYSSFCFSLSGESREHRVQGGCRRGEEEGKSEGREGSWSFGELFCFAGQDKALHFWLAPHSPIISLMYHSLTLDHVQGYSTWVSRLWSGVRKAQTERCLRVTEGSKPTSTIETHGENITMTWSPDGRHIVLGNRVDKILWIDVEEQTIIRRETMPCEVTLLSFSRTLLSGGSWLYFDFVCRRTKQHSQITVHYS